jgi:hypothetical protein
MQLENYSLHHLNSDQLYLLMIQSSRVQDIAFHSTTYSCFTLILWDGLWDCGMLWPAARLQVRSFLQGH